MTSGVEGNAALKRCSTQTVVPTLPKTGEGWGTLVCGRSGKIKIVGQECPFGSAQGKPTHTVIGQAGSTQGPLRQAQGRLSTPRLDSLGKPVAAVGMTSL
jgi:hypothetical protein